MSGYVSINAYSKCITFKDHGAQSDPVHPFVRPSSVNMSMHKPDTSAFAVLYWHFIPPCIHALT